MKLYLDSSSTEKITVKIDDYQSVKYVQTARDRDVFSFLKNCFNQQNIDLGEIDAIEVFSGFGSFTGTRVGVSIANALSFALKIPVNGKLDPFLPVYSSPPNITTSK